MENTWTKHLSVPEQGFSKVDPEKHAIGIQILGDTVAMLLMTRDHKNALAFEVLRTQMQYSDLGRQAGSLLSFLKEQHPWFGASELPITFLLPTRVFMLVPESVFNPLKKEVYLEPLAAVSQGEEVLTEKTSYLDSCSVYSSPWMLESQLKKDFPDAVISHENSRLLNLLSIKGKAKPGTATIFAYCQPGRTRFLVSSQGKMLAFNDYLTQSGEDILYYLSLLVNTCSVKASLTKVFLSGHQDETLHFLNPHFLDVQALVLPVFTKLPASFKKVAVSDYLPLFCLIS